MTLRGTYDISIVNNSCLNNLRSNHTYHNSKGISKMTAKEYLEQIRTINLKIVAVSEEIAEIRAVLGAQAIKYDREPGQGSGSDKTFNLICKLIDKQDELMEQYIYLSDKKQEIKDVLYKLSKQIYAELLYKRYFEFKRWSLIADEMSYSEDRLKRLHKMALDEISTLNNIE